MGEPPGTRVVGGRPSVITKAMLYRLFVLNINALSALRQDLIRPMFLVEFCCMHDACMSKLM